MVWDAKAKVFHYPCPCGDRFEISKASPLMPSSHLIAKAGMQKQLSTGEDVATCPSCSLIIRRVVFSRCSENAFDRMAFRVVYDYVHSIQNLCRL